MPAVAIIGAQWGDEGKGKVVDLLAESADVVVRYAGGANAGHTLVIGEDRLVLRLVPSGVLHPHTQCLLAQGMVLDPSVLLEELDALTARGIDPSGRLFISDRAHLILPYHVQIDSLREAASQGTKIGTTKRGIGPCYEDKIGRRGVRVAVLADPAGLQRQVAEALRCWQPIVEQLGGELPTAQAVVAPLLRQAERLLPLVVDTSVQIDQHLKEGKRVMFEGAQGTLLDIDHGTYPFVTSSSTVAGGACSGAGIGPTQIDRVIGIAKAYLTRVGAGPFPTEATGEAGAHLRDVGVEFGSVTGRPRSTGWLDLPALRYARRINGLGGLAMTKLDVLTGLDPLRVCVAYDTPQGRSADLPIAHLEDAKPVYETRPGWTASITGCRSLDQLPAAAQAYLHFVEEQTELPLFVVSVGARRSETIVLRDPFG